MTTNTTLLVTLAKPNLEEIETFQGYVEASTDLALAAGGVVSSRFSVDHLEGDAPGGRLRPGVVPRVPKRSRRCSIRRPIRT